MLWGFELERSAIKENDSSHKTVTNFKSGNSDWQVETRYVHFSWSDIISRYENVPYPQSFFRHMPSYLAFLLDGSFRRYAKASRRYWGFSIYPILLMVIFGLVSYGITYGLLGDVAPHWLAIAIPSFIVFLVLCKWPGDRFYINLSINDWAFARDMCKGSNPEIDKRYETFAENLIKEIQRAKPDEILVVGHSFGSVWAVVALAIAMEKRPNLFKGRKVTFLALGSSLLKIGLVKRAKYFKAAVSKVISHPGIFWHEIQTKTDFISFYKSDPFVPMKIADPECEVIVHRVNFKKALSAERHRKMLKSMYLAHRQYILYCDRRVHHDFQLRVFGPFFADELAKDTNLALQSELIPAEGQQA